MFVAYLRTFDGIVIDYYAIIGIIRLWPTLARQLEALFDKKLLPMAKKVDGLNTIDDVKVSLGDVLQSISFLSDMYKNISGKADYLEQENEKLKRIICGLTLRHIGKEPEVDE